MSKDYGIVLIEKYYVCMVDIFVCVGYLREVEDVILIIFFKLSVVMWGVLFVVC